MIKLTIILAIIGLIFILFMVLVKPKQNKKNDKGKVSSKSRDEVKENINQARSDDKIATSDNSFIKIYASLVPNTKISLQQKVAVSEFEEFLKDGSKKTMLQEIKHVYMWDFGVNASKHLKKGDKIWILTGDKLYETDLLFIIKDELGQIGDAIGWARQFGGAWKNVAIFSSCNEHDRIPDWVHSYSKRQKRSIAKNFYKIV